MFDAVVIAYLSRDDHADEIAARLAAPLFDQRTNARLELTRRCGGLVLRHSPSGHAHRERVKPREVLGGEAQRQRDHVDRHAHAVLGIEIGVTAIDELVDIRIARRTHVLGLPPSHFGQRERGLHD